MSNFIFIIIIIINYCDPSYDKGASMLTTHFHLKQKKSAMAH